MAIARAVFLWAWTTVEGGARVVIATIVLTWLVVALLAGCAGRQFGSVSGASVLSTPPPISSQGPASATQSGELGTYLVRAIWQDAPISKARIYWRANPADPEPVFSGSTVRFGTAQFRPQAGTYFITAEWRSDGDYARLRRPGDRFAYLPVNPVVISSGVKGEASLVLDEVFPAPPLPVDLPTGEYGVFGRVTVGVGPQAGIGVFAYPNADTGFRGNDFKASAQTNDNGIFRLDLPPGSYYLLARKRSGGGDVGPLKRGDVFGYDPSGPVAVEAGRYTPSSITANKLRMIKSSHDASAVKGTVPVLPGQSSAPKEGTR